MEYPRPSGESTTRRRRHDDAWLIALLIGCSSALIAGCIAVTSAVRDLPGDTGSVVDAIQAGSAIVLLFGLAGVVASRRLSNRRQRELTMTKERFRAVYDASPAGIVETDLQQRIVHCNAAFGEMIGLGDKDILGHQGWEFFHPMSPPPDLDGVANLVAGVRTSYSAVRLLRAADGSPRTVKLDWAAITGAAGAVTHLACVITDISEQALTDAELRRAHERADALWRQASIGVIEGSPEGVITSVNATFAAMLGHRPEDLVGTLAGALADPAYTSEISEGIAKLKTGQGYVAERRYLTADGRSLPVLVSTAVFHDDAGAVDRIAGFVVDMSELYAQRTALTEAHDELARRQSFTDALLETLDVGIVSCAPDGSQLRRNWVQRELLGLGSDDGADTFEEVLATTEVRDLEGAVIDPANYPIPLALRSRGSNSRELLMGPRGGPHRQLVVRARCITSPDGTLLGAVAAVTDVSAERHAARELAEERSRLAEAQQLGQLGSFTFDIATGRASFSDEIYRIWGLPHGADLLSLHTQLIHPDDLATARANWKAALAAGGVHNTGYRITRPDGDVRYLRVHLDVGLSPGGSPIQVHGTHLDITDLQRAHLEAAEASALVSAVLVATPDFTFVTDTATGAVVYAPEGKEIVGITSETLMKHGSGAIAALVHSEDQEQLRAANAAAGDLDDGEVLQIRYRLRHADGSWHWVSRRVTPFRRDATGRVVEVLGVVRDVTDLVEAESQLQHSALHDPLTGLPNRALLMDRLDAALGRAMRTGREATVLFCDLDGFKRVNDTAGHAAGDAVLIETSRRIHEALREHDTVARVGGDEFVIIIEPWKREPGDEPVDDRALALKVAERLAAAIRQPIAVDGVGHLVTASIGITYTGILAARADDVLRDADAAMYLAKHGGKDRYEVYESLRRKDPAEGSASPPVPARRTPPHPSVVHAATGGPVGFEA